MIDLNKIIASSQIQGLAYVGELKQNSVTVSSFSLGAGDHQDQTLTLDATNENALSTTQIKISGMTSDLNNKWIQIRGGATIYPTGDYGFAVRTSRSNGLSLIFRVQNISGSSTTIPTITYSARAFYFKGPW